MKPLRGFGIHIYDEKGFNTSHSFKEPHVDYTSMLHEADARSPRTALTPIPETPECSRWQSSLSPSERTDSDLSDVDATTPRPPWARPVPNTVRFRN